MINLRVAVAKTRCTRCPVSEKPRTHGVPEITLRYTPPVWKVYQLNVAESQ
jgi:hypothetical protein